VIQQWLSRWRLRGGIHPETRKQLSSEAALETLPPPPRLHISLQQHIGAAAAPAVKVGDHVLKGQLIAASQGNISAPLHAPTSGVVVAIHDHPAPHPSGLPVATITLDSDGEDRWMAFDPPADPFALAPEEIARRVAVAGIVGLGGAAFPAAVKLTVSRRSGVKTLVINGSECEPYLTCDDRLMRERAAEVVYGMRLIRHAVAANRVVIGIEDNKAAAIAAMRVAAEGSEVEVVAIPTLYPMGSEKQLIQAVTGHEIPAEGRAADIGVLVHNVGTAWAVYRAIALGQPLVSRIVTVSGGAVARPRNLEVAIGTPVHHLLAAAGGVTTPPARLVMGGPMMGFILHSDQLPIIKGSSGVLALTASEVGVQATSACIRCGSCVRACPVGLLPLEMVSRIRRDDLKGAVALGLRDCLACGSCSWVCPAHIPLVHHFNYARGELAQQERNRLRQEATRKLAAERTARLERVIREREEAAARRKAEKAAREAAAKAAASEGVA
jgi:Na+-translocating ferredoxin:NAD+ oxidoreductase subunit C